MSLGKHRPHPVDGVRGPSRDSKELGRAVETRLQNVLGWPLVPFNSAMCQKRQQLWRESLPLRNIPFPIFFLQNSDQFNLALNLLLYYLEIIGGRSPFSVPSNCTPQKCGAAVGQAFPIESIDFDFFLDGPISPSSSRWGAGSRWSILHPLRGGSTRS